MERYKVVKIMRCTGNRRTLEKDLTRDEAKRLVQSYPDSQKSMVVFIKQD